MKARLALALGLVLCTTGRAADDAADDVADDPAGLGDLRFTEALWSQNYPDRDYLRGCTDGFLAFEFSPTGYFIFDNRLNGSWRQDELGNLVLRTRDGRRFRLVVDGDSLRLPQDQAIGRRGTQFQKCTL